MALPQSTGNSWFGGLDRPSQWFGTGSREYDLYEEDDEFVLSVELPGYEREDITVAWDDGVLNVAAEHENEDWGKRRTYHRRFRFPRSIVEEDISAHYRNGILEVHLPVEHEAILSGQEIEVQA